jgi:hypothetical protein
MSSEYDLKAFRDSLKVVSEQTLSVNIVCEGRLFRRLPLTTASWVGKDVPIKQRDWKANITSISCKYAGACLVRGSYIVRVPCIIMSSNLGNVRRVGLALV